jgi:hypothetical protein
LDIGDGFILSVEKADFNAASQSNPNDHDQHDPVIDIFASLIETNNDHRCVQQSQRDLLIRIILTSYAMSTEIPLVLLGNAFDLDTTSEQLSTIEVNFLYTPVVSIASIFFFFFVSLID